MQIPPQTSDIFTFLSKGQFLSINSQDASQLRLYQAVAEHEAGLRDYFAAIDLHLQRGLGYFYFTRPARGDEFQERLDKVMRQLDTLDFLLMVDLELRPGHSISWEEMWERCKVQPALLQRLDQLSFKPAGALPEEKLKQLFRALERETFLENISEGQYRVLSSFDYLLQLIDHIELRHDRPRTTS